MEAEGAENATDQVRTAVRFPMRLALKLKTAHGFLNATTENISANGILFTGPKLPKMNSQIEFTIAMPAATMGTSTDVSIHCRGRVVRYEQHGDEAQAAAIIDEYILRA